MTPAAVMLTIFITVRADKSVALKQPPSLADSALPLQSAVNWKGLLMEPFLFVLQARDQQAGTAGLAAFQDLVCPLGICQGKLLCCFHINFNCTAANQRKQLVTGKL
ncbi:hypothetical protein ABIE29_004325 [Serratia sp. 2723]